MVVEPEGGKFLKCLKAISIVFFVFRTIGNGGSSFSVKNSTALVSMPSIGLTTNYFALDKHFINMKRGGRMRVTLIIVKADDK
ncbi:hypothetical protein NP92_14630, partial [Anoxybacillus gonensis]|uniref:hypothetical protein n=1 Tax=Anoxybacillus gonensis TaxID=198467 RepID=UPI00052E0189